MKYISVKHEGNLFWQDEDDNLLVSLSYHHCSEHSDMCGDILIFPDQEKGKELFIFEEVHLSTEVCGRCSENKLLMHNESSPSHLVTYTDFIYEAWYYKGENIFWEEIDQ